VSQVKVRIAPSPTGDPHVGTAYIALFNYALAKKEGGTFTLRIEDTDRTRTQASSEKQIFDTLRWCGLNWDEGPDVGGPSGPYRQSERFSIYKEYAQKLIDNGTAYYCFCTEERLTSLRERQIAMKKAPGYDRHCRSLSKEEVAAKLAAGESYVIRLKMPYEGQIVVKDALRGDILFDSDKIDDQVLLKSDGFPTYHLANVVDDKLMGITHVIRAEEWIASTPKHIQLYRSFGWTEPVWCHMPLLRNNDKTKISKRKNHTSLLWYIENGYLKEAMLNFLALMGYSYGDNKEIFTLEEMAQNFSFSKISLGGPVFDIQKLNWINNIYMREKKTTEELAELALPFFVQAGFYTTKLTECEVEKFHKILDISKESAINLKDLAEKSAVFFKDAFELPKATEEMEAKEVKTLEKMYETLADEKVKAAISLFISKLEKEDDAIAQERIKEILHEVMENLSEKPGRVIMPVRIMLTGEAKGPDLGSIIHIIGKSRALARIQNSLQKI